MSRNFLLLRISAILNLVFIFYFFSSTDIFVRSPAEAQFDFEISGILIQSRTTQVAEETTTVKKDLIASANKSRSENSDPWEIDSHFVQRGEFWVGYNRVKATKTFTANESITMTTPSDHTNLDNLVPLVERWRGPISCTLFAPGTDYVDALKTIHYLRTCTSPLIKELVTFHLIFPRRHIPKKLSTLTWAKVGSQVVSCDKPVRFGKQVKTYRKSRKLLYPINVARNVARESATTHFVFANDVELYPSLDVIPDFLSMVANDAFRSNLSSSRKVFVLPVFELLDIVTPPGSNFELQNLYAQQLAVPFHKYVCKNCHNIPDIEGWLIQSAEPEEPIFEVLKRRNKQKFWEPFYIGTKTDPVFDERVTWEGSSNKRIQAYALCLLDYEFHVLSKAFLVHRPGIRRKTGRNMTITDAMDKKIRKIIVPELQQMYGYDKGCRV